MRMRFLARAVVATVVASAGVLIATPAHAASSCAVGGQVATVTADDLIVDIGASGGNFVAQANGGANLCPVKAISALGVVDVNVGPAVRALRLRVGSDMGYGPAVTGRDFLPTNIIGGASDLQILVIGGGGDDFIRSFAQPAGSFLPWGIDLNFVVDEDVPGSDEAHILLGMQPELSIRPGVGQNTTELGPGRPEIVTAESGFDRVSFAHYPSAYADLDGLADDGGENDQISNFVDALTGSPGNDTLVGNDGSNNLTGGDGHDILVGRGGDDTIVGQSGDDTVHGGDDNDVLFGLDGNDRLLGGDGRDALSGGLGADTLDSGQGDDSMSGGDGNDVLTTGSVPDGSDFADGGLDMDTMSYAARTAAVRVSLDGRANDGAADEFDDTQSIERVIGGTASDILAAGTSEHRLDGGPGNDRLVGGPGPNRLDGGAGNDVISGNGGDDVLLGGPGNDRFVEAAGTGNDSMSGGRGVDTAEYAGRASRVVVRIDGIANDGVTGETDNVRTDVENVIGTAHSDTLVGSSAANALSGGAGNDTITGGLAADRLDGGRGNDTIKARDGKADRVIGGTGTDRARVDAVDSRSGVESLF